MENSDSVKNKNVCLKERHFDRMLSYVFDKLKNTLEIKAKEYMRNGDMLHNFNQASKMSGVLRELCINNFKLKHEVNRADLLMDLATMDHAVPSKEMIDERWGDIIVYNILEMISLMQKAELKEDKVIFNTTSYEANAHKGYNSMDTAARMEMQPEPLKNILKNRSEDKNQIFELKDNVNFKVEVLDFSATGQYGSLTGNSFVVYKNPLYSRLYVSSFEDFYTNFKKIE